MRQQGSSGTPACCRVPASCRMLPPSWLASSFLLDIPTKKQPLQVDQIFYSAALAANQARLPLAKMAVAETRMGVVEDKVIKVC